MRWLEWLPQDPTRLIGGVETHVLSMARCLRAKGVQVEFSSDPAVLFDGGGFDIVRTHGDLLPKGYLWKVRPGPYRIHTLHGSALGQMKGLGETHRARHWKAFYREWSACVRADLVAGVHSDLELYRLTKRLGHAVVDMHNGWNASDGTEELPLGVESRLAGRWAFVGRGWDPVKGGDRVLAALERDPSLELVVVPGDGLPDHPRILKTGRLSAAQIRMLLRRCAGLLLPSRFEGFALVLLEALAEGVPVVATRVGGNASVERCDPRGLHWFQDPNDPELFLADLRRALDLDSAAQTQSRSEWNRAHLWSWEQCTDLLLDAVIKGRESAIRRE